ncbi:MAG: hypothetical protein HFF61_10535 [Oscillospiraceae bacterium]|jgi:hypothetical protein|nr:hypothetical protein [Oscillospiraceae bacterium]
MMNASDWLDLTVLERKKYNYLNETLDLTQQIGSALDHNDQISLKMLLAMRQEPIMYLEELKQTIQARRQDLPPEDQERVQALLSGASPRTQEESTFIQQAATVVRLLQRVMELDRAVNLRLTGSSSVYNKK